MPEQTEATTVASGKVTTMNCADRARRLERADQLIAEVLDSLDPMVVTCPGCSRAVYRRFTHFTARRELDAVRTRLDKVREQLADRVSFDRLNRAAQHA